MIDLPGKVELLGICYFNSIRHKKVIPNIVPDDVFYIEIILDGEVMYGDLKEQCVWCRGTILWHAATEETIWRRVAPDKEFVSFAMRFRKLSEWKRPGHIGRWKSLDELDEFVVDTMRWTYNQEVNKVVLGSYLIHRLLWEFYASTLKASDLPPPLAKVITLMQNEDLASLGITALANTAQVSETHLHALFRKHLGETPHHYLLRLRLKRARVLLSGSNHPVKQIGFMCGFRSTESFYRVFKQETGLPPAQYRRRHTALLQADILRQNVSIEA